MRYFWIIDSRKPKRGKPCGILTYDDATREFSIRVSPDADVESVPMLFIPFIERGELEIPHKWALEWVQERIPPVNRQNIGEILEANGLDEYDELTLLVNGEGRCSQDDFMIQEAIVHTSIDQADGWRPDFYEYAVVKIPSPSIDELKAAVGEAFRAARIEQGISQDELSQRSEIPRPTISRIERGLANPTLETLAELADGLNMRAAFSLEASQ